MQFISAPKSIITITLNSYSWQTTILIFENHFGGINLLIRSSLLISIGAVLERGGCWLGLSSSFCSLGSPSVCSLSSCLSNFKSKISCFKPKLSFLTFFKSFFSSMISFLIIVISCCKSITIISLDLSLILSFYRFHLWGLFGIRLFCWNWNFFAESTVNKSKN